MVGLALITTKQCYPTIILGFGVVYCPKSPILKVRDLTQILRIYETWDLDVVEGWGWLVWHSEPLNNVIQP